MEINLHVRSVKSVVFITWYITVSIFFFFLTELNTECNTTQCDKVNGKCLQEENRTICKCDKHVTGPDCSGKKLYNSFKYFNQLTIRLH